MVTLGIETSGRAGSVALVIDGTLRAERQLDATGRRHARTLVPEIGEMLRAAGRSIREVEVVAVSVGPGSFTGLRVGVVCAKTWAYATGQRLVGVDTFLAIASAQPDAQRVSIIDDALRGDVFAGDYVRKDNAWQCITAPRLISLVEWKKTLSPDRVVSGPGVDKLSDELSGLPLAPAEFRIPRAREIALLGERRALAGEYDDAWTLEPHYIRRSAAEEKRDGVSAG